MRVNWTYKGKEVTNLNDFESNDLEGFVYKITMQDGSMYIGKKNFFSKRKRNFGKKELVNLKDKRKKTYEYVVKESNWQSYTSSNKEINRMINSGAVYFKEIIETAHSKGYLTYLEVKYMFLNNVLLNEKYLNDNILGKFYKKNLL